MRKNTVTHTPGSGRLSLGLQHQINQAVKAQASSAPKTATPGAFNGDIPPGKTIHVQDGVITGYS